MVLLLLLWSGGDERKKGFDGSSVSCDLQAIGGMVSHAERA
jgi:hypothetical protein